MVLLHNPRYCVDCDCIYCVNRGGGEGREKRKVKEGERMGIERMEKRERGGDMLASSIYI